MANIGCSANPLYPYSFEMELSSLLFRCRIFAASKGFKRFFDKPTTIMLGTLILTEEDIV